MMTLWLKCGMNKMIFTWELWLIFLFVLLKKQLPCLYTYWCLCSFFNIMLQATIILYVQLCSTKLCTRKVNINRWRIILSLLCFSLRKSMNLSIWICEGVFLRWIQLNFVTSIYSNKTTTDAKTVECCNSLLYPFTWLYKLSVTIITLFT